MSSLENLRVMVFPARFRLLFAAAVLVSSIGIKNVKSVPILLPFAPLYSVEKHKRLVA